MGGFPSTLKISRDQLEFIHLVTPDYYSNESLTEEDEIIGRLSWKHIVFDTSPKFLKMNLHTDFYWPTCLSWFFDTYFQRLSDIFPFSTITLFPTLRHQGKFLFELVSLCLDQLRNKEKFHSILHKIILKQYEQGIRTKQYGLFGEVLLWSLKSCLGSSTYNERTSRAWLHMYSHVLDVILPIASALDIQFSKSHTTTPSNSIQTSINSKMKLHNKLERFTLNHMQSTQALHHQHHHHQQQQHQPQHQNNYLLHRRQSIEIMTVPTLLSHKMKTKLITYMSFNPFKKLMLRTIADVIPPEEKQSLLDAFRTIDADGDGRISLSEFQTALRSQSTVFITAEIQDILTALESGEEPMSKAEFDVTMTTQDFVAANICPEIYLREEYVKKAFERFDVFHDGVITLSGLRQIFDNSSYANGFLASIDRNGDGVGTFEEFRTMMTFEEFHSLVQQASLEGCGGDSFDDEEEEDESKSEISV